MRAEYTDVMFYLEPDWEKRTIQDEMDKYMKKKPIKGFGGLTFYRKYEERREAEILQGLENSLVELVV